MNKNELCDKIFELTSNMQTHANNFKNAEGQSEVSWYWNLMSEMNELIDLENELDELFPIKEYDEESEEDDAN